MRLPPWLGWPAPSLRFERLEARHAAVLADIHAGAFARPWEDTEFERLLSDRAVWADGVFKAEEPDPVGFVLSRRVFDEAEILSVAIAPAERGRGYAAPLLRRHLSRLAAGGVRKLHLEVQEGNAPALALYGRVGFAKVGRRAGYYRRPDGTEIAALTMSLTLPEVRPMLDGAG
jgi:ribosomal-protein-alanine N-acetyltransferase